MQQPEQLHVDKPTPEDAVAHTTASNTGAKYTALH